MAAADFPSDNDLFAAMDSFNPWWRGGGIPSGMRHEFKRRDHATMLRRMGDSRIHVLIGPRQVGKTTVLYQLADELLSANDPERVMLASLDEAALFPSGANLRRMLDLYAGRVLREPLQDPSQATYVLLDEVQAVRDWQIVLKNMVDRRGRTTFVVSGSSSADLARASESLLGRVRHQVMMPMSFSEYLAFRARAYAGAASEAGAGMRRALSRSVRDGDAGPFHRRAGEALADLALAKSGILADLSEYMVYGGCPGIAAARDRRAKADLLRLHLRLSIYHDILKAGSVRNPSVIESLLVVLARRSPHLINKERIAKNLGINKITLDAYLGLLGAAYLVSYAELYGPVRSRAGKKVYVNDAGIRNAAASRTYPESLHDSAETGLLAESVAGDHTRRLWEDLDPAALSAVPRYWRSGSRGGGGDEVDLVVELEHRPLPIEVKYRRHVDASDLRGLSRFSERFGAGVALALTQDQLQAIGDATVAVPLWLYLLMCP